MCIWLSCSLRHVLLFDTQFKCSNRCLFKAHFPAQCEEEGEAQGRLGRGKRASQERGRRGVITNTPTRQLAAAKKCEMQDTHNEIGRPKKVGNTK